MFWQTSPTHRPRILQFCHITKQLFTFNLKVNRGGFFIVTLLCDLEIIVAGIYLYTELLDINFVFLTEFNPDEIE